MKVSTKGRYALRMMLDLALNDRGEYISLRDISLRQGITVKYLEQIVTGLTRAGFLKSQRGNSGAVSCTGFGGKLFLHLSRNIYGAEFEQFFLDRAGSLGLLSGVSHHILA